MEVIVGDKRVEIDMGDVVRDIDIALHNGITDKTGVIVVHNDIIKFVSGIIRDNNAMEARILYETEQDIKRSEKREKEFNDKVDSGKVVHGTDTFVKRFKYHILGYVDVGKGDKDE